jgi:pyruvate dehydrogenase (quinone)
MGMNVSGFVWQRLRDRRLARVYGYPGDGVGGLDVALQRVIETLHYVQVRHEEIAAFTAPAHAKFTGEVGLRYATFGPGAIHPPNGLYDTKMDHMPVVACIRALAARGEL